MLAPCKLLRIVAGVFLFAVVAGGLCLTPGCGMMKGGPKPTTTIQEVVSKQVVANEAIQKINERLFSELTPATPVSDMILGEGDYIQVTVFEAPELWTEARVGARGFITLPLIVWMMRSYFEEIPVAIEQAAMTDGYSWLGAFTKLVLPLAAPGVAASVVLAFIFSWNNFVFGLMLGGQSTQPVTVGLMSFMAYNEVLWGQMAAATVITIVPEIILALLVQPYMIRGLTFGAVK